MKGLSLAYDASNKVMVLLTILGATLLIVNGLLVRQNKQLKVLASRPDRVLEIRPGTALPPLEGIDSNGNRQRIDYGEDSRKTVLLVFSPRCGACEKNMPNWKAIINGLDRDSFRLAAVSLQTEGFKEYVIRHGISEAPALGIIDPKYRVMYNLALTPQIILIDSEGKAERVWTGLLQEEDKESVEQSLNVRLP
jgi:hypothetical protein